MNGLHKILIAALACCGMSCSDEVKPNVGQAALIRSTDSKSTITSDANQDDLRQLVFDELETHGNYRRPSGAELERAEQLFEATFSDDAELVQLQLKWKADGFDLRSVEEEAETFWILRERADQTFGRGIVAIRRAQSVPVMFQAPHSFYDRGTDKIAMELFIRSRARVCFWNSIHRRVANLTEEADSYLNALSVAFARTNPRGRVIQIHGFSQTADFDRFSRKIDLIISQGNEAPSQTFLEFAQSVRRSCDPFKTAVFPLDVHELGGTQNRQRSVLLGEELTDFVHCELSPSFRHILQTERDVADRLGHELTRLELNPETD